MLQIAILLLISCALVWWYEKGSLAQALGLMPGRALAGFAGSLFLVTAFCCVLQYLGRMHFGQEVFALNPNAGWPEWLQGLWQTTRSVLFEELLCRGALLYLLLKKLGHRRAIVFSALVFGLLHLRNLDGLSNLPLAALSFFYPFVLGLVLAYAFARSGSIYLPLAIHLGWNLVQNVVFPGGPWAQPVLIIKYQPIVTVSYFAFFLITIFPKLAAVVANYLLVWYGLPSRQSSREQPAHRSIR